MFPPWVGVVGSIGVVLLLAWDLYTLYRDPSGSLRCLYLELFGLGVISVLAGVFTLDHIQAGRGWLVALDTAVLALTIACAGLRAWIINRRLNEAPL